jgi:hypothetical protein
MTSNDPFGHRKQLWFDFCRKHGLGREPVPLFATSATGQVDTVERGRPTRSYLQRSPQMEALSRRAAELVIGDHSAGGEDYEGLLYCMFELRGSDPHPLYIGKTEKFGKKGQNLSANLDMSNSKFARWGYGYEYHIGDLSAVVLGHDAGKQKLKYERWADELFQKPYSDRRLKEPVYFWVKAWKRGSQGPWVEFGETSLTFVEYLLIGMASAVFPRLLNDEGVNR